MLKNFIIFILFIILTADNLRCQLSGFFFTEDGVKQLEIPFENHNNLIVITVRVNKIPLRFILDSGVANTILIDQLVAKSVGLNYERVVNVAGAGSDKIVNAFVTRPESIELDGITGTGQSLLVLEEDFLKIEQYFGLNVQGLIGYELLNNFVVGIDYERNTVTFQKPERFRKPRLFECLPIEIELSKPFIRAPVEFANGIIKQARLLVDLGASHSCMFEIAQTDTALIPVKRISGALGRGLGGEIPGFMGRVNSLSLGKYSFQSVISSFTAEYSSTFGGQCQRDGMIGSEILSRFTLIFNYPENCIYLKSNSRFNEAFEYNMSGIEMMISEGNTSQYQIFEVRENSPAYFAGLKTGDKVVRINGVYPSRTTLADVSVFLRSKPNRKIKLRVIRDGINMVFRFKLQRLI